MKAVRLLSSAEHKAPAASKATIHPPPPPPPTHPPSHPDSPPKAIGKSNVSDLHFPSLDGRAKLLRFPPIMSEVERVVIGPRSHFHEEVERSAKELKECKKYITVTVTKNMI